jgi:hypothetical protein
VFLEQPAREIFSMFFLHPVDKSALRPTDGSHSMSPASSGFLLCSPLLLTAQQSPESWQVIYRQAYEQLLLAFAPSPFQHACEPSAN